MPRVHRRLSESGIALRGPADWILAFVLVLVLVLVTGCGPAPEVPIPDDLSSLDPQLNAYLVDKIAAARRNPRDAAAQAELGIIYAVNELWPEARRAFSNVMILKPEEPLARLHRAVAVQQLGDETGSREELAALVERHPDFVPGLSRFGDALLRAGRHGRAKALFERWIRIDPSEWRAYAGLAETELAERNHTRAAALLEQALGLNPRARIAHHLLGLAYRGLNRIEEAERELRLGLNAVHTPLPDAWSETAHRHMKRLSDQFDIANQWIQSGQPDRAAALLTEALHWHPENLETLENLAMARMAAGEFDKARALLDRVLKLRADHAPAHRLLADAHLGLGNSAAALGAARRAIDLDPDHPRGHLALANVWLGLNRTEEALEALGQAARRDPANPAIHLDMGDLCARFLQRPEEAVEHYRRAHALDPANGEIQVQLAATHLALGQTGLAREALNRARVYAPGHPALPELQARLSR